MCFSDTNGAWNILHNFPNTQWGRLHYKFQCDKIQLKDGKDRISTTILYDN